MMRTILFHRDFNRILMLLLFDLLTHHRPPIIFGYQFDCQFTKENDFELGFLSSSIGTGSDGNDQRIFPLQTYSCREFCSELEFEGVCHCLIYHGKDVRLKCSQTNASILMADIEKLNQCPQVNLIELHVKDSNLTRLYNLPSGLYNIQSLVLENTGIDLETIRESQELLRSLRILRIINENFTEIPETLFNGMEELKQLSLNNLGMAYINVDAFVSLQDSLISLELRSNRIRTIPTAVQSLSHLECLDLSDNQIKSVSDSSKVIFSTDLKRLRRLRINPMNCSCEFGKSRFAKWLRTYAIKGVQCSKPEHLIEKDVSNMPIEEFCEPWPPNRSDRIRTNSFGFYPTIAIGFYFLLWRKYEFCLRN
ncbi:cytochrome P450 monooxygenase [Sarcoptes scabiei]|nr:cytochrome P450 monooxygenase [Sarcoptes scabiei]